MLRQEQVEATKSGAILDSVADGVMVADEADLSLTGNASVIGRPTGTVPIAADPGNPNEQDLTYDGFVNLVGGSDDDRGHRCGARGLRRPLDR